jgi:CDP-glucose 4,6-dehydratase
MGQINPVDNFNRFYNGKKVLVTGHTGFKGSWLCIWLLEMGAEVVGIGLDPYTEQDNFVLAGLSNKVYDIRGDIRDLAFVNQIMQEYKPDIVFHLAAQPLVRLSYDMPVETYEVNVMGTIHILEAIRKCEKTKVGVMITTDKCYENKEQIWGYRENEPMGGHDPYSSSKGATELAIASWRNSFFNPGDFDKHGKSIASARAGNVIGGGDWAKDRIVPDCIRALESNKSIEIRNPQAVRPWQHVLEPLSGYLLLAKKMWDKPTKYCEGWNFGPSADSIATVWDVAQEVVSSYGKGKLIDKSDPNDLHEAKLLMLDVSKARQQLGWKPKLSINESVSFTIDWYRNYQSNNTFEFCVEQIRRFI